MGLTHSSLHVHLKQTALGSKTSPDMTDGQITDE